MTIRIEAPQLAGIYEHARRSYPAECCGALVGLLEPDGDAELRRCVAAIPLENEAVDVTSRFLIAGGQHRACERFAAELGFQVVGFYHSHPDHPPTPSFIDHSLAWPWYCFVIAAVGPERVGPVRAWRLRDDRSEFTEIAIETPEYASGRE